MEIRLGFSALWSYVYLGVMCGMESYDSCTSDRTRFFRSMELYIRGSLVWDCVLRFLPISSNHDPEHHPRPYRVLAY